MRMAEHAHADARDEIEIGAAVLVEQTRALTADEHHGLPLVGLQHVLRFECRDVAHIVSKP